MGIGAIIGAVGSIAGAGLGLAGKMMGGGNGSSSSSSYNDQLMKIAQSIPAPAPVDLRGVTLPAYGPTEGDYIAQSQQLPGMAATAAQADQLSNQAYQRALNQVYPGLSKQIGKVSTLADQYLSGIIPQDVQDQIQRATAQQATQGGYGATSGMGRNLTARDLGLTSMSLQQTGLNMMGVGANAARAMNPSFTPVSSLMFTPSQLLARQDQSAYYNTDTANQQNLINSANQIAYQQFKASIEAGIQPPSGPSGSGAGIGAIGSSLGGITSSLQKLFGGGGKTSTSGGGGGGGGGGDGSTGSDFTNPYWSQTYGDYQAQQMGYSDYAAATAAGAV